MNWFVAIMILVGGQWQSVDLTQTDVPPAFEQRIDCIRALRFAVMRATANVEGVDGVAAYCQQLRPA